MTQELTVTLASSITYVSGTVNGKAYTFTLANITGAGSVWSATVDRAEDDTYHIALTAIDNAGSSAMIETTVYYGMRNLITDRTQADVLHWRALRDKGYANMTEEERAEWDLAQMKGAYNPPWDMNRVGAALNYLRDRLIATNYLPPAIFTAKADWTAKDIPTAADLRAYLSQVEIIRAAMAQYPNTPKTPEYSGGLDYQEANDIEKILLDIDQLITNMLAARVYCGELFSGER